MVMVGFSLLFGTSSVPLFVCVVCGCAGERHVHALHREVQHDDCEGLEQVGTAAYLQRRACHGPCAHGCSHPRRDGELRPGGGAGGGP